MKNQAAGLCLCAFLMGCGSGDAPFGENDDGTTVEEDGGGIDSDRVIPPGTPSPTTDDSIFRREPLDGESGNGFATGVQYNSDDDTFRVDNLPFDGGDDTPYVRGTAVSSLGDYAVYEAVDQYPDTVTGAPINQFTHRAIYGVSKTGNTEFAIIRTGAYIQYGFGGFIYQRTGGVTMPTSGQGLYTGKGAGIRDYNSRGGLDYTTADVEFAIDFDDFNEDTGRYEGAVDGFVFNRRYFDIDGNEVTSDILARINAENDASLTQVPVIRFVITPNALDANGELTGEVFSQFGDNAGKAVTLEEGNYYAVLSGDNAAELVGVIVTESTLDPSSEDGARDTIGFNLHRE